MQLVRRSVTLSKTLHSVAEDHSFSFLAGPCPLIACTHIALCCSSHIVARVVFQLSAAALSSGLIATGLSSSHAAIRRLWPLFSEVAPSPMH